MWQSANSLKDSSKYFAPIQRFGADGNALLQAPETHNIAFRTRAHIFASPLIHRIG